MKKILKILHVAGVVMFIGSIIVYLVISGLAGEGPVSDLVFARKTISAGTMFITLPGMWLAVISGFLLSLKAKIFSERWVRIKFVLGLLIVLNAHLMIGPAIEGAFKFALLSFEAGKVLDGFRSNYLAESVFGGINLLMSFFALVLGIVRPWKGRTPVA